MILNYRQTTDMQYSVSDMQGRIVMKKTIATRSFMLNFTDMDEGVYLLKIVVNNQIYTTKLVLRQ